MLMNKFIHSFNRFIELVSGCSVIILMSSVKDKNTVLCVREETSLRNQKRLHRGNQIQTFKWSIVCQERRSREGAGKAYGQVFDKAPKGDKTHCIREVNYVALVWATDFPASHGLVLSFSEVG